MIGQNKITNPKLLTLVVTMLFLFTTVSTVHALPQNTEPNRDVFDDFDWENGIPDISNFDVSDLDSNSAYPEDFNVGQFLSDNDNSYQQVWDPWVSKAAIHAVATYNDGDMLALAGGYLYDNQIHLYRWNYQDDRYDLVWEIGGGIFQSDVTSLAFSDVDYNNLTEIVAGGEDGVLYVFEQRHLYDPYTNMENMFDLVWKSPRLGRIFDVMVYDSDADYRQDIIVGTGDTVRWYEYDTHGSYPFGPDHFIEFREVFSLKMPSQVTALGISDVNSNGLKEVATGLRSGEIHLLENDGETLLINGNPYPIVQDNAYVDIWNSGNVVRRPISDMEGGDLDQDGEMELMIAVQGQGAYILDTIDGTFGLFRVQREFQSWEANPVEIYPLDVYTDSMINSSSWFNNTEVVDDNDWNVYWNAQNTTLYPEPLNYTRFGNFEIYPYSSYSVMNQQDQPDGIDHSVVPAVLNLTRYTTFDATVGSNFWGSAWAVYDWGNDEEAAGNGISTIPEMKIYVEDTSVAADRINISISADNTHFYNVNSSYVKADPSGEFYTVEVDPTMGEADINFYRYFRFELLSGKLLVDVFETTAWNNPIYDALSVETGFMTFKDDQNPTPVGYVGTIDGAILAITWDSVERKYVIKWDSWNDERWKLKTNIFDLEVIKQTGRFPGWIDRGTASDTLDLSGNLPDGGAVISWTAENFYNSRNENFLEYVVISEFGNIYVYQQTNPYAAPLYNAKLTDMLFGSKGNPVSRTEGPNFGDGVKDWVQYFNSNGNKYFSMSILPIDVTVVSENVFGDKFDPYRNGFMLYLGGWDGSLGNLDQGNSHNVARGDVDVSIWYLVNPLGIDPNDSPDVCDAYGLPVCSYFEPLKQLNNFNHFYDTQNQYAATLSTQELTGQMWGTFSASTWMPKVAAADFIADRHNDYVVTNGKVTLLEAQFGFGATQLPLPDFNDYSTWPSNLDEYTINLIQAESVLSEFSFVVKGGYFDTINENSKGRHWSNANPVDWDGDGDMDLVLGFATYSTPYFGMDKVTFGATYWENQGSREEPKWVENPLAITNTDFDSGFRSQNYTDPLFIYDEYDMSKVSSSPWGYHPSFRTGRPQRLLMWQPIDHQSIFTGSIHAFFAEYNHPSSLLAATYPEAKRIDINLQYKDSGGYNTKINYGFHVFETWDNSEELNDWTLSLSTADLDEDGKNEIIVGDFNNNIYVFEHLSNNTYKRAFKSFDVNRTIETNLSPYAYEQFEGISGEFSRTLFDHIEFLIAGMDLNNNSRQEFVAATENMVFIFEATSSPTGRIVDDTYQLIKIIDLLDFPTLTFQKSSQTKISALTWADDLTQDGRRELIIAATSGLLILEVEKAPTPGYKESGQFIMEEIFFGDSYNLLGLYDFPGNFYVHPELIIETVLVEDLDSDGFLDIAIGGTDTSSARPLYSGFLNIMEWSGSSLRLMEEEGIFYDMTKYNPVHDLAVDDADLDGHKELLVGHEYGIDIFEFTADNTIVLMEVLTSSPHYRFPDRYYNVVTASPTDIHKDVIRAADGQSLIMVVSDASGLSYLTSTDEGKSWIQVGTIDYLGSQIIATNPSLAIHSSTNEVWLSFAILSGGTWYIYIIRDLHTGDNNLQFVAVDVVSSGDLVDNTPSPRLFNVAGNTDPNIMGLVHIDHGNNNAMRFVKYDFGVGSISGTPYYADWANTTIIPQNFVVHSLDIVQLDGNSRNYGVVFSGYPFGESKSLDLDLFYDEIYLNNTGTWKFNFTSPNRLYSSGMAARNPSIIQEHHTGNLLVTYEEQTLRPYGGLWGIWSNDRGTSWNGPHDMSHPLGFDNEILVQALPTKSRESYVITTAIGFEAISDFVARIPVVVPGNNRGFTMVYNVLIEFQLDLSTLNDQGGQVNSDKRGSDIGICRQPKSGSALSNHASSYEENVSCKRNIQVNVLASAINPWSNFTWYNLGAANEIVVGDTDRDSRHEILVASGKQAFLYEFSRNAVGYIKHDEKWQSSVYDRDITGIAISDANGNGFPEIVIESDRGVVQTFEVTDTLQGISDLLYTKEEKLITSPAAIVDNSVIKIITADLNQDGIEDFVYATLGGWLVAINGKDYSELWSKAFSHTTTPLYQHTKDLEIQMRLVRDIVTGNPFAVVLSIGTELYWYNPLNGDNTYSYSFDTTGDQKVLVLRTGDVILGGAEEILVGLSNGTIFLMNSNTLSPIWNYDFDMGLGLTDANDPTDIQIAQFTNANTTEIAVMNLQGDVIVLTGSTKAVAWQTHIPLNTKNVGLAVLDSNGDSKPDIVISQNATFALNGLDGSQIWNSSSILKSNTFRKALVLETNNLASANEVRNILQSMDIPADIMNVISMTPTVEQLLEYDIVISVAGIVATNPSTLGDNIADFLDQNGKFITYAYSYVTGFAFTGRLLSDSYLPLTAVTNNNANRDYDGLSNDPVLSGVSTYHDDNTMDVSVVLGSSVIASYVGGMPMVAVKGNVMIINSYFDSAIGDVDILVENSVSYFLQNQVVVHEPLVYDANDDGVNDIIYTMYHQAGEVAVFAMSGSTGDLIWTYTPSVTGSDRFTGHTKLVTLQDGRDILIFQHANSITTEPGLTILIDPVTGVADGGIRNFVSGIGLSVSNLGGSQPLIIVGDSLGSITIHSLWAGQPIVIGTPPLEFKDTPFFRLGADFTKRTEYLVYDSIKSPLLPLDTDLLGDGVDDVFVLDDDFIGAGDTYTLLNDPTFNKVEWDIQPSDLQLGRYLGGAVLGDVDGDNIDDIVAPFENYFVAVNVKTGVPIWTVKHHYQYDDFNQARDFHFQLAELDDTKPGLEVVYSRFIQYFGWPISEIAIMNGVDGVKLHNFFIPFADDVVFNTAYLDNTDVMADIVFSANYFYNPVISFLVVFDENLGLKDGVLPVVINGMFPITEIAVASFDNTDSDDEFIYFFEMSELNLPEIIYNLIGFPTLFIQFDWVGGTYALPQSGRNIIGIAPTGEPTANYWIDDRDSFPYMIVESTNGDLYNYPFDTGTTVMQDNGIIRDKAIPYARTTFVTTDLCGGEGFIILGSANTIDCYKTMNFSNLDVVRSLTLEFSVVQDMVIADLDDDPADDLLIASYSGHVWVILSGDQPASLLQLNSLDQLEQELDPVEADMLQDITKSVPIMIVGLNIFMGIMVIKKKRINLKF